MKKLLLALLFCIFGVANAQTAPIIIQHVGEVYAGQGYLSEQFLFDCTDTSKQYKSITITIRSVDKQGKVLAETEIAPFNIGGSNANRYNQSFAEIQDTGDDVAYFQIVKATSKVKGKTVNLPISIFEASEFRPIPIKIK